MRPPHLASFVLGSLGVWLSVSLGGGCNPEDPNFGPSDADADTDADTDTDTDTDADTDADTDQAFDDPGDVVELEPGASMELTLEDVSGDSNKDQEFYLLLVNAADSPTGYTMWYSMGNAAPAPAVPVDGAASAPLPGDPSALRERMRTRGPVVSATVPLPMGDEDVGVVQDEFHVRDSLSATNSYAVVTATLWAVGRTVTIWVDDDVPIDHDVDCDGEIDQPHPYPAYGFTNCDLSTIASIADANIMVNVEHLLGEVSDVNGDERVTVLITPVLNAMPLTSADEDDWTGVVESYADPDVDLQDYDPSGNPGSDEQEIIYVFAPDPYGFYNPFSTTTVDEYTSVTLAGQIAQVVAHLALYNQHVLVMGGDAEQDWLKQGIGAVAADLTGFGSIFFDDAWDYLDAPHLQSLTLVSSGISTESRGPQYLFLRWLVDTYGSSLLSELSQTDATGVDNLEAATGTAMEELVLRWQMALLTTGLPGEQDGALVDATAWPPYADPTTVSAPVDPPTDGLPGTLYGANGYQQGVAIRGTNRFVEGGTSADPVENEALRVTLDGTDHLTYLPGFPFYGYLDGGYTAQVVRVTGLQFDVTRLNISATGDGLRGAVVRWYDPNWSDLAVEEIYSPADANAVDLPALPADGTPIYGLGEISAQGLMTVYNDEGLGGTESIDDTDRWRLDLTDRAMGELVDVVVWLDRHFENDGGDPAPYDPWLAIVREDHVPAPTVEVSRSECPSGGAVDFAFPTSLLSYLYTQQILSGTAATDSDLDGDSEFDPCGIASEDVTSCADDWDLDGVPDTEEPQPGSFLQQVQVAQCAAGVAEADWADWTILDADTVDEDELPTIDRSGNTGGRTHDSGEEAWLSTTLEGGYSYLIVVGAGSDTGVYELTIRTP